LPLPSGNLVWWREEDGRDLCLGGAGSEGYRAEEEATESESLSVGFGNRERCHVPILEAPGRVEEVIMSRMSSVATASRIQIEAPDGIPVVGYLFPGEGPRSLLISGAVAVPQSFYRPIATFFQNEGYSVVTYDYRGVGESLPAGTSLRSFDATASDWALQDQRGALQWMAAELGSASTYLLGHSLGGQVAGLNSGVAPINAMITVSSQSGYWRHQGGSEPLKVLFHVSVSFPILCALFGYLPWSKIGRGCDLPKGAALQWASWCRHPKYLFSDATLPLENYQHFEAPILAYSIDDDDWGTARSVDALMSNYPNVERRHLVPHELGFDKLGHMGYFRSGREVLWGRALEWLASR
jgi:predicted alpha/beta hydrolase